MQAFLKNMCFLLALCLCWAPSASAQSQADGQARAYYFQAEGALGDKRYDDALDLISKAETLLGSPNASTSAMKVKIYVGQGKYTLAQQELGRFYTHKSTDVLAREMSAYPPKIDQGIADENARQQAAITAALKAKADEVERKRLADIAAKNARIQAARDKIAQELANDRARHRMLERYCEDDYEKACAELGYRYQDGVFPSTSQNQTKAAEYYARGCRLFGNDDGMSCNNLGELYEFKDIPSSLRFKSWPPVDLPDVPSEDGKHEAFLLYKHGCRTGEHQFSCWNLGRMYVKGVKNGAKVITEPSKSDALAAFKKACAADSEYACADAKAFK